MVWSFPAHILIHNRHHTQGPASKYFPTCRRWNVGSIKHTTYSDTLPICAKPSCICINWKWKIIDPFSIHPVAATLNNLAALWREFINQTAQARFSRMLFAAHRFALYEKHTIYFCDVQSMHLLGWTSPPFDGQLPHAKDAPLKISNGRWRIYRSMPPVWWWLARFRLRCSGMWRCGHNPSTDVSHSAGKNSESKRAALTVRHTNTKTHRIAVRCERIRVVERSFLHSFALLERDFPRTEISAPELRKREQMISVWPRFAPYFSITLEWNQLFSYSRVQGVQDTSKNSPDLYSKINICAILWKN